MIGLVYYADDPHKRVFRYVKPIFDDRELDAPAHDGEGRPYLKDDGTPHSWTTLGTDPARVAVMVTVPENDPAAAKALGHSFDGTPGTPANEPPGLQRVDVGYVAPKSLVEAVLDLAEVTGKDTVIDLGSGYGPFLIAAAKCGADAIGIELDRIKNEEARERAAAAGVSISIEVQDFNKADLSAASVVIANIGLDLPPIVVKPGTRVVIVDGEPEGWGQASKTVEVGQHSIRLWVR